MFILVCTSHRIFIVVCSCKDEIHHEEAVPVVDDMDAYDLTEDKALDDLRNYDLETDDLGSHRLEPITLLDFSLDLLVRYSLIVDHPGDKKWGESRVRKLLEEVHVATLQALLYLKKKIPDRDAYAAIVRLVDSFDGGLLFLERTRGARRRLGPPPPACYNPNDAIKGEREYQQLLVKRGPRWWQAGREAKVDASLRIGTLYNVYLYTHYILLQKQYFAKTA